MVTKYALPFAILLLACSANAADYQRDYGVATVINFCLANYTDPSDFEAAATFEAGDIKLMKDEGAEANTIALPTDEGTCYSLALSAVEMEAERLMLVIIDQTGSKVWLDKEILIETDPPQVNVTEINGCTIVGDGTTTPFEVSCP